MAPRPIDSRLLRGERRDVVNLLSNVGELAHNTLYVASDVVDNTTVTIGGEVWRIDIISTDTTKDLAANLPNNSNDATLAITAHGKVVGDLLRIDNEIMRIIATNTDNVRVRRGACGTAVASHTAGADILGGNRAKGSAIPLGLTATLTPAVFVPAFAAEVNAGAGNVTDALVATPLASNAGVLFTAKNPGLLVLACSETLAGANNAWAKANIDGGQAMGSRRMVVGSRVPTAAEVAAGLIVVPVDFDIGTAIVRVRTTATGAYIAWDGGWTILDDLGFQALVINNVGATDWAITNTVDFIICE
jgi:hypothetical protein